VDRIAVRSIRIFRLGYSVHPWSLAAVSGVSNPAGTLL
jgi:hypothetical protein